MKKIIVMVVVSVLLSCSKDNTGPDNEKNKIVGTWKLINGSNRLNYIKYDSKGNYFSSNTLSEIEIGIKDVYKVIGDTIIYGSDPAVQQKEEIRSVTNETLELTIYGEIFGDKPVYKYNKVN